MAKTSLKVKQQRKPKFPTRAYTRCRICGRPHSVLKKYGICRICSLKQIRHIPYFFKTECGLAHILHLVYARVGNFGFLCCLTFRDVFAIIFPPTFQTAVQETPEALKLLRLS